MRPPVWSATAADRIAYIRRHWDGGFSLGYSYWINGVLLGVVVEVVQFALSVRLDPDDSGPAHVGLAVFLMASDVLIVTWQNVGIWRSATAALAARTSSVGAWMAMLTAGLALLWQIGDAAIEGPNLLDQLGDVLGV